MIRQLSFGVAWLLITIGFAGCAKQTAPPAQTPTQPEATTTESKDHHHGSGPHGGTITDWGGGKYHVEFTVDHDKKETTVYIIGSDAKSPAPVKAKSIQLLINDPMTEMELVAKPLEGETSGMSSRFVGTHETLGIVREFSGTISGVVGDTPFTGDFKEDPH